MFIKLLFLPVYSPEAGGEFGSSGFMMCHALATLSVPRTSFFCTRTLYVIIWTGHDYIRYAIQSEESFYSLAQNSIGLATFYRLFGLTG